MKGFKRFFTATFFSFTVLQPVFADIVLDSFDYTYFSGPDAGLSSGMITMNTVGAPFPNSVANLASVVGAHTTYDFYPNSGNLVNPVATTGNGQLQVSYGNGLTGLPISLDISYYGGPGGIDFLSYGSSLAVWVEELDLDTINSGFTVTATLIDSAAEMVQLVLPVNFVVIAGAPQLITVPFESFVEISAGTFNWTAVEVANLVFTAENGNVDFTLGSVGIVPEPGVLGLLGIGLIALSLRRKTNSTK